MPSIKQMLVIAAVAIVASFVASRIKVLDVFAFNTDGAYWL